MSVQVPTLNHTFYAPRFLSFAYKELLHCLRLVLGAAGRRGSAPGGGAGGRGAGVSAVAAAVAGVGRGAAVAPPTTPRLLRSPPGVGAAAGGRGAPAPIGRAPSWGRGAPS